MNKLYETITAENWYQGGAQSPDGKKGCLLYHLRQRYYREANNCVMQPEYIAVKAAIATLYPEYRMIQDLNDNGTIEDVIRVCKVADV